MSDNFILKEALDYIKNKNLKVGFSFFRYIVFTSFGSAITVGVFILAAALIAVGAVAFVVFGFFDKI